MDASGWAPSQSPTPQTAPKSRWRNRNHRHYDCVWWWRCGGGWMVAKWRGRKRWRKKMMGKKFLERGECFELKERERKWEKKMRFLSLHCIFKAFCTMLQSRACATTQLDNSEESLVSCNTHLQCGLICDNSYVISWLFAEKSTEDWIFFNLGQN